MNHARRGIGKVAATPNAPIVSHPTDEESVFLPENLLTRASSMLGKQDGSLPPCCLLDFDGELVPTARDRFGATACKVWPCFHTAMFRVKRNGVEMGIIGGTVGAPFAALVAEQLIAAGCRHIIGYSSSGAICDRLVLPCLVVPERAWRDEGTSYHYLPPAPWAYSRGGFDRIVARHAAACELPVHRGATWTTDAPYRETRTQIEQARKAGALTVEMEAAALMAVAQVRGADIASLLHVTNAFATTDTDFHKGPNDIHDKVIECCLKAFAEVMIPIVTTREEEDDRNP